MRVHAAEGFTLIEALFALSILGIALASILPGFLTYLDTNSGSEERSDAVAVAQQVMEGLRQQDPSAMPSTGSSAVQVVTVGTRDFEAVVSYCVVATLCATNRRHVRVEVSFGGNPIYSAASLFTDLR